MGALAGRAQRKVHALEGVAIVTDALDLGQLGGSQDTRDGVLADASRHHAAVYASGRQLVEHGGVGAAHSDAAGAGWTASPEFR